MELRHICFCFYGLLLVLHITEIRAKRRKSACRDYYGRHCRKMTPDRCYLSYNKQLCCAKCTEYLTKYSSDVAALECPAGDRHRSCGKLPLNFCYSIYNRYICCASCSKARMNDLECRYGDRDPEFCSTMHRSQCYEKNVASRCCTTCPQYKTGPPECPFGDHGVFFKRGKRWYTCSAYVGHFGDKRCKTGDKTGFKQTCCHTCKRLEDFRKLRDSYYQIYLKRASGMFIA